MTFIVSDIVHSGVSNFTDLSPSANIDQGESGSGYEGDIDLRAASPLYLYGKYKLEVVIKWAC